MSRRGSLALVGLPAAAVLSVAAAGCGLAAKQDREDRIASSVQRILASSQVRGLLSVSVLPLRPHRAIPSGSARIAAAASGPIPLVIDTQTGDAAVAGGGGAQAQLVFTNDWMYERRPANPSADASSVLASTEEAATNVALLAASPTGGLSVATTTTTTSTVPQYQAISVSSHPWLALDYSALSTRDQNGVPGSLAISPTIVLRLAGGALTGSVVPATAGRTAVSRLAYRQVEAAAPAGSTIYQANFSLDKAEKDLTDPERQVIAKVMTANAVTATVFPGYAWLTSSGALAGVTITFPEQVDSDNQAELYESLVFELPNGAASAGLSAEASAFSFPGVPRRSQVITVGSLGSLIHQVAP